MPSNHLILCHPLLLLPSIFLSIRVFSIESVLHVRCPKYWSFSFSISPFNDYSGLISFRITGLISLQSKGLSIISRTTVQKHQYFDTQPSLWSSSHIRPYLTTGKTIALIRWNFVGKVTSLLFNTSLINSRYSMTSCGARVWGLKYPSEPNSWLYAWGQDAVNQGLSCGKISWDPEHMLPSIP